MQELLAKYFEGKASIEELQSIENWIVQNPMEFEQFSAIWNGSKKFSYPEIPNSFDSIKNKISQDPKKLPMTPRISWKIAASFILLAAFSLLAYSYFSSNQNIDTYASVYVSKEDIKQVDLSDGTKVWLKPNSKIEVSNAYNEKNRSVKLKGDAFFEVARNENKPFLIESKDVSVQVLGTSFGITETRQNITVAVKTGKVKVSNEVSETTLIKHQAVTHIIGSDEFVFSNIQDQNQWAWIDKVLTFEETDLKDVISKVEETYGVSIQYNHSYDQVPFTGRFDNNEIEEILTILKSSLNIDFKVSSSTSPL